MNWFLYALTLVSWVAAAQISRRWLRDMRAKNELLLANMRLHRLLYEAGLPHPYTRAEWDIYLSMGAQGVPLDCTAEPEDTQ